MSFREWDKDKVALFVSWIIGLLCMPVVGFLPGIGAFIIAFGIFQIVYKMMGYA
jgi:hypothetical protein